MRCWLFGREDADLLAQVVGARRHQLILSRGERPVHDAHEHDDADVVVEPAVDDESLWATQGSLMGGGTSLTTRSRMSSIPMAGFNELLNRIGRVDHDHVLDLFRGAFRVGGAEVHLVQNQDDLHAQVDRRV